MNLKNAKSLIYESCSLHVMKNISTESHCMCRKKNKKNIYENTYDICTPVTRL